tara:strand:- start:1422 stop:1868 length:447 start_codon:yes stop_codon:yes gene_type:complete
MPIFDPDGTCPLLKKKCIKHKCVWYNMLQGAHPQTGLPVQEWGCSIAWMPLLMVENAKHIQGTQAATESFRNEMVKSNKAMEGIFKSSDSAKNLMLNATTIFELIGNHQRAVKENIPELEEENIRQLSNNKIKVKKGKKVSKNGNNSK